MLWQCDWLSHAAYSAVHIFQADKLESSPSDNIACYRESITCLSCAVVRQASGKFMLSIPSLLQGEYHMFIAQTPHIDPLMFHLALQQNAETDAVDGAEKTAFAWYATARCSVLTSETHPLLSDLQAHGTRLLILWRM